MGTNRRSPPSAGSMTAQHWGPQSVPQPLRPVSVVVLMGSGRRGAFDLLDWLSRSKRTGGKKAQRSLSGGRGMSEVSGGGCKNRLCRWTAAGPGDTKLGCVDCGRWYCYFPAPTWYMYLPAYLTIKGWKAGRSPDGARSTSKDENCRLRSGVRGWLALDSNPSGDDVVSFTRPFPRHTPPAFQVPLRDSQAATLFGRVLFFLEGGQKVREWCEDGTVCNPGYPHRVDTVLRF